MSEKVILYFICIIKCINAMWSTRANPDCNVSSVTGLLTYPVKLGQFIPNNNFARLRKWHNSQNLNISPQLTNNILLQIQNYLRLTQAS